MPARSSSNVIAPTQQSTGRASNLLLSTSGHDRCAGLGAMVKRLPAKVFRVAAPELYDEGSFTEAAATCYFPSRIGSKKTIIAIASASRALTGIYDSHLPDVFLTESAPFLPQQ